MEYRKQQFETYEAFTQQFSCDYSQPLARGGHGEIYRGVDLETNEEVAIKRRLYSPSSDLITLEKEFTHTQALPPNRFVVRYVYYGRYATPFGTFEFLVMKFYRDGNLTHNALPWSQLSEAQRRRFTEEFLKGLAHLHRHQVIHRDIKPENILLVKYIDADGAAYRPVIADFGISKLLSENPEAHTLMQNSMRVGTVTYMAPEQLRAVSLSYNADLWSFGIILYEIITGKYMIPRRSFPDLQREEAYVFWRNTSEQRFPADMDHIAEPYQQIIRRCLLADPAERVQSTDELLALLAVQPQLAEADRLVQAGLVTEAIEQFELIESRASLPLVGQKLNELRLQQALARPVESDEPQSDRPVEVIDGPAVATPPVDVPALPELPVSPPLPPNDDGQRTQQFTEQFDVDWPMPEPDRGPLVSPLAAFRELAVEKPRQPDRAPRARPGKSKKSPQPAELAPVMAGCATPDEPFAETDVPVTDQPAPLAFDEIAATPPEDGAPVQSVVSAEALPEESVAAPNVPVQADVPTPLLRQPGTLAEAVAIGIGTSAPPQGPPRPSRLQLLRTWAGDVQAETRDLYSQFKASRHRRLILMAAAALLLGFLVLNSSEKTAPAPAPQTALVVSEDYRQALKLFKEYQVRYEKTGELNPYLWAFEHCNPDYSDSLEIRSAILRAQAMVDYTQLIFPDATPSLSGFKRQEMKHIIMSKGKWERLPHDLNCAPSELLEKERASK